MRELGETRRHLRDCIDFAANTGVVRQVAVLALALVLALPLVLLVLKTTPAHAQDAALRLPDLRMAHPQHMVIREGPEGGRILRFTGIIVNVGAGAFELHGQRPNTTTATMSVTQRIYNNAGGYQDVPTSATMFYSGDGHDHWHVADLVRYKLRRLGGSGKVHEGAKQGFCFFDYYIWNGTLPRAPENKHYSRGGTCGESEGEEALQVEMGLSVGWSDVYEYYLPGQWVDITGLPSGRYRLAAVVDERNLFRESRGDNNYTWLNIELKGMKVKVLQYGPSAPYCGRTGQSC